MKRASAWIAALSVFTLSIALGHATGRIRWACPGQKLPCYSATPRSRAFT
jgi:hypothetical protein